MTPPVSQNTSTARLLQVLRERQQQTGTTVYVQQTPQTPVQQTPPPPRKTGGCGCGGRR